MTDTTASALAEVLRSRYTLERELGRGGMATVYLARDLRHDRPVAFKVLRPELTAAFGPERFLREIRLTARLQHPHILTVLDSGEAADRLWFTMPFVEGESVRARLARERQLSVPEALRIARDAAEALGYAHQHGVIHRDVKPDNLLLTTDGSTLVADFGLARSDATAVEDLTEAGLALGTPLYMSPEQASGARGLDARTDIYSLGCVLFEMLAGEPPFPGRSPAAILARKSVETVPSLRVLRDTVPEALEAAITRALARVPADRFSTMREFAQAIEAAAGGAAGGEPPPAPARSIRTKGRKTAVAALIATMILVAGVLLWGWTHRGADLVATRVAVGIFENRTGDRSFDPLGSIAADWLSDGILRSGVAEVVPTTATLLVLSSPHRAAGDSAGGSPDFHRLAEETGAATIVSGSYYRLGDSLQFQARLLDAGRGKVIQVISPVAGSADRPLEVIEMLRQRVVGALAVQFDTASLAFGLGLLNAPPTYAAYKSYLEALRLFSQLRIAEGIPHLDSALAQDSTFASALLLKAWAHASIGDLVRFDSVIATLERQRQRLSPAEGYELEWLAAARRGDLSGARRALRQQAALSPDAAARYGAAVFALRTNHPAESLNDLTPRDRESLYWRTVPWTWQVPTEAYHLLGDHSRELDEARHGRRQHDDLAVNLHFELVARAALGQVHEVHALLDQALQLAPQPIWTFGSMAASAGLELQAHGHADSARRVMLRAIDWYRAKLAEHPEQPDDGFALARCLYWAGQWSEARELLDGLVRKMPLGGTTWHGIGTASDFDYLGLLGSTAARQGDTSEAHRVAARLASIEHPNSLFGQPTLWRAKIAALLGQRDSAVSLLRDAISQGLMPLDLAQGLGYPMWLHREIEFQSLREYQPYLDLLRPAD